MCPVRKLCGWLREECYSVQVWSKEMMDVCVDCGAVNNGIGSCQELYESFLSLEFSNPDYGEVHFLTVGIYMIQHNRYSRDSLRWICPNLRSFLEGTLTIQQIRDDVKNMEWESIGKAKILRSPEEPPPLRIQWKMTIADVAGQYEGAAGYRALIRQWAEVTLNQSCNMEK